MTWIQGNLFKGIAKWHYAPARIFTGHEYRDAVNNIPFGDYRFLKNTLDFSQLEDGDVIYTHTFYADQLFEKLKKKVTVITHSCDNPAEIFPPEGVRWYSTNVNIRNENLFSIPIGIENDFWLKDKKEKMLRKLQTEPKYKRMVYCNHNVKTNPKRRQKPYDILSGKSWATVHLGANGSGFDTYLDNIYNHPFVICPEGNGIDTHRIWECLYMGSIPVVTRNINLEFYTDLPILFLEDWEELSEMFLHDVYFQIKDKKWNMDKLTFEYWKNEILS